VPAKPAALPAGEDDRKAASSAPVRMWTLPGLISASRTQTSNQYLLNTERRRDNRT